jgi:hypothetical protein
MPTKAVKNFLNHFKHSGNCQWRRVQIKEIIQTIKRDKKKTLPSILQKYQAN